MGYLSVVVSRALLVICVPLASASVQAGNIEAGLQAIPVNDWTYSRVVKSGTPIWTSSRIHGVVQKPRTESIDREVRFAAAGSEFGVLVTDKGAEETYYTCTVCHSERIIAQQGLPKKAWAEVLVWMVDEQEMEEIEEPDYSLILNYLAKHYNTDRPNFPK